MLSYEPENSPFYEANKIYCETVESKLKTLNAAYKGFCNSFGYTIEASFIKNDCTFHINWIKTQSTRNGVVVPVNAQDYSGAEITIDGFDDNLEIEIGRNTIKRLFMPGRLKGKLPSPYFAYAGSLVEQEVEDSLIKEVTNNQLWGFKLRNGKLKFKIHNGTADPIEQALKIQDILEKVYS